MDYQTQIERYQPVNEQETTDKQAILSFIRRNPDDVLLRSNAIAHITSSGFILNPSLEKVLFVHHNIRGVWGWTGGHMDGDTDSLYVAQKEAREETGVHTVTPLFDEIASLDVLPVPVHRKNERHVSAHLHLSVAHILICDEADAVRPQPGENSAVQWFPLSYIAQPNLSTEDVYVYTKLVRKAQTFQHSSN